MQQLNRPPDAASACPAEEVAGAAGVSRPSQRRTTAPAAPVRRRWYAIAADPQRVQVCVFLGDAQTAAELRARDLVWRGWRVFQVVGIPFWPDRDELRARSAEAEAARAEAGVGDGRDGSILPERYWSGRGY